MTAAGQGNPEWVALLGAEPRPPSLVEWLGWSALVATFGVTWDAVHQRRNKDEVQAFFRDEYGKVLLHARDGSGRTVAEIEVVKALRAAGWPAGWTDSYGRAPGWMTPGTTREQPPSSATATVSAIRAGAEGARPWDVVAWREGDGVLFVECKGDSERFTKSELAFLWGAHQLGIPVERFAVVRGAIRFPAAPPKVGPSG